MFLRTLYYLLMLIGLSRLGAEGARFDFVNSNSQAKGQKIRIDSQASIRLAKSSYHFSGVIFFR